MTTGMEPGMEWNMEGTKWKWNISQWRNGLVLNLMEGRIIQQKQMEKWNGMEWKIDSNGRNERWNGMNNGRNEETNIWTQDNGERVGGKERNSHQRRRLELKSQTWGNTPGLK